MIVDPTFNKSVCLDLESFLIRLFAGDGKLPGPQPQRRRHSTPTTTGARSTSRPSTQIFQALRARGAFTRPVREIENTDLFKLSPFKALSPDQAIAVEDILNGLFEDIAAERRSRIVIQGDPGHRQDGRRRLPR